MFKFFSSFFTIGIVIGLLSSCGQTGPLYLPKSEPQNHPHRAS